MPRLSRRIKIVYTKCDPDENPQREVDPTEDSPLMNKSLLILNYICKEVGLFFSIDCDPRFRTRGRQIF